MSAFSKVRTTALGRALGGPGGVAVDGGVEPAGESADCATIGAASTVIGGGTQPTMSARTTTIGSNLDIQRLPCTLVPRPRARQILQDALAAIVAGMTGERLTDKASTPRNARG